MITFIKEWANQIIVAVIIATIFEMLLPNGNNKKYIKMIIGIYVLFTMLQPIASKLTGEKIDIANFNYEKYINKEYNQKASKDFENNNSKLIKNAYIDNIKSDIGTKLKKKGYKLINCNIDIALDKNKENYGAIEYIVLSIEKIQDKFKEDNKSIEIEKINVGMEENNIQEPNLTNDEKIKIIEYLSEEYSINKKIIVIN